jgi:ribonuclease T2
VSRPPLSLSFIRRALLLAGLLFVAACTPDDSAENTPSAETPSGSGFDFYVLTLSWSPSYCEAEGAEANRQQCGTKRPYAFIVHGLWPQFERGYPEFCEADAAAVDEATMRGLYDLMPSAGLIRHQWRKHGSCSGLSQQDYFRLLRVAREAVVVPSEYRALETRLSVEPAQVERAFLVANPGLGAGGVAVTCTRRLLREVRICMTPGLEFRDCPEVDRRSCQANSVEMPPTRG